ncbi:diguanylate cyclase [Thiosulfatihalobacter marinus]|jgi:two-component system cell cycle response regulator|uniref:diguanylate cyclase n=1 Tax=Thiosulfatihalobacter marinus TaxID=2792481 RepID=UPI0018D9A4F7|nr:diguanylate cyclase [Thiosulfatihalobacter marinus]
MAGRILIVDSVATNRIVLKVKLASAFYHVEQASNGADAIAEMARNPPAIVLLGGALPDMTVQAFCRRLRMQDGGAQTPVIIVAEAPTRAARLDFLQAGVDDVISRPQDDAVLLARIRSLLRNRDAIEELRVRDTAARALGFAEPPPDYEAPASVAFVTGSAEQGVRWRSLLQAISPGQMRQHSLGDALRNLSKCPPPDAFVIALQSNAPEEALRFLAEIRARSATRKSAVLVVQDHADPATSIDALDLGANDVMPRGFDPEEAALRLAALIRRKRLADRLRQNLHDGLNAAVTDPLTGLHNRRFALPQLARIARQSGTMGTNFAVMVADLDHFKDVNDRYGHVAGDVVLAEIARRMRATLSDADLIARIGGEEFLIVVQGADRHDARAVARRLCAAVRAAPVYLQGRDIQIPVTVSIGVAMGDALRQEECASPDSTASDLLDLADQALYGAKAHGRDQVTLGRPAA